MADVICQVEEAVEKASCTGGSPSISWGASKNVLGQWFRQKWASDLKVRACML